MEARSRRFTRLLDALDELVARETATLEAREFSRVAEIQERAAPVIAGLAELGPEAADAIARARVAAIVARRQHNVDFLESQLAVTREELLAVQQSEGRMARIAPAYGRAGQGAARRWRATG